MELAPTSPPAARNIELKCRCRDLPAARAAALTLGPLDDGVQTQVDTYFPVPKGRLKLREMVGVRAELIWYDRADAAEVRSSDYRITPVADPAGMRAALAAALGVRGEVRKVRHVLLWHNVRIHLDDVAGLGTFVEFEAVVSPEAPDAVGYERLAELCRVLAFSPSDRVDGSYSDLLHL